MRCEVLRLVGRHKRVAIVRTDTSPRVMGEVPLTKDAQVCVGDILTLKVWFHQVDGRIVAKVFINGSVS